jgi:hypothetical protein
MSNNVELANKCSKMINVYLTKPESSTVVFVGTCIVNYNSQFVLEMVKDGVNELHFIGMLSMRDHEPQIPFAAVPNDAAGLDGICLDAE